MKIEVGNTTIPYIIKESERAQKKRIVIQPESVEIIVPTGTSISSINDFMEKHKNKVFLKKFELMEACDMKPIYHEQFQSGIKILHYGRMVGLNIERNDVSEVAISLNHKIIISIPNATYMSNQSIKGLVESWQKDKIKKDAQAFIKYYGEILSLYPKAIRVKEQKHLWASCGKDKIINLNWRLIQFPKSVLEYVLVHELCHLKHRNHSSAFWKLVASTFPDWQKCKKLLEGKI